MAGEELNPIAAELAELNRLERERFEEANRRAEERHRELIARGRAGERVFLAAFDDLHERFERSEERADARFRESQDALRDMRESIRANTAAVLAALDRFGPAPG